MMKNISLKFLFLIAAVIALSGVSSSEVLLNDTWADGSRAETNLPTESAVWAGDSDIVVSPGSLQYGTLGYTDSHKLWTYFTADGAPATVGVGEKLVATIDFIPRGLYVSDAENFRMGLYHDPTDSQVWTDTDDDGGGSGDPWTDSTGYGIRTTLSSGAGDNPQVGKRIDLANTSLLGSSGAYSWASGGANVENMLDDNLYTARLELDYISADQMDVTFSLSDAVGTILTQHTLTDDGTILDLALNPTPIYTNFDHLFFRFSAASGTADVIDFQNFNVELIPEPATLVLLGLGGLVSLRKRR